MAPAASVTVVLPVYNAETTLEKAARSILDQTHGDLVLRIVDDGSTDGSRVIAEQLAREDGRVEISALSHAGLVRALQSGTEKVETSFLARMDADDWSHPERLSEQIALLEHDETLGLCGTNVRMTGECVAMGRRRYECWLNALESPDDCRRAAFIECPVAHPTFCMRTEAFRAVGGYTEEPWPEDYDVVLRMLSRGYRVANVPRVLLDWTEHPKRLSMNDARYGAAAFREIKRHYLEALFFELSRSFYQWGAGEVGKPWLKAWDERRPEAVVDIRPGKIGQTIHGYEVIRPEALPPPGECYILIAVGTPGARALIRDWLNPRGYIETEDYRFLA